MIASRFSDAPLENCYRLAAIRGVQAGMAFYMVAVPFGLVRKMLDPKPRPSFCRRLNSARLRPMTNYFANARPGHVIPPVHVSVRGEMRFEALAGSRSAGSIEIDLGASFDIIDGRHRIAAIVAAAAEHTSLARETLPVCLYAALDADASSRMFDTLNRKAIRPPQHSS
jgi:DNA sulfur modification protein DndB